MSPGLCRRPLCYRNFKGSRGLSVHLSHSKPCNEWYEAQARDRPKSPVQSTAELDTSSKSVEDARSSPLPWSSTLENRASPLARQSRSVTLEDADEDDAGLGDIEGHSYSSDSTSSSSDRHTEFHPTAGRIYGKGRTILQEVDDKDQFKTERIKNVYYPFMSRQDFEMGAWLSQSNVSMSQIDDFLKLSYVCPFFSMKLHAADFILGYKKGRSLFPNCPRAQYKASHASTTSLVEISCCVGRGWNNEGPSHSLLPRWTRSFQVFIWESTVRTASGLCALEDVGRLRK